MHVQAKPSTSSRTVIDRALPLRLRRFASKFLSSEADCEDAAQQALATWIKKRSEARYETMSPSTRKRYIFGIVRHEALRKCGSG